MGVLGKDLFDLDRPLTRTKVEFGERTYWVESDRQAIPYGAVLTELLDWDVSAYKKASRFFERRIRRRRNTAGALPRQKQSCPSCPFTDAIFPSSIPLPVSRTRRSISRWRKTWI